MEWKRFRLLNNILGWITFAIAAVVYLLTIGPSTALWDCPEFTLSAYNLEVGHPPGAPFYMLVYNVVSHLVGDPLQAAFMCNIMSALLSAATILLLFFTIVHLVRRALLPSFRPYDLAPNGQPSTTTISWTQSLVIWGSALVGSLAYTFSDTFWYSAVEAEVYAFSSFFTALVFWLIFIWEDRANSPYSDRWIILIAYCMGLSIGVHLLNLLVIPAMALLIYFRKSKTISTKGALLTLMLSAATVAAMMYGVIQGAMRVGTLFDVTAVNRLGLPVNSGFYFYLILLVAVLSYSAYCFAKDKAVKTTKIAFIGSLILTGVPFMSKNILLNLLILAALVWIVFGYKKLSLQLLQTIQMILVVVMIGFSSYGVILVRSLANTPMNQNHPANAVALQQYLNRSQYGEVPLLYGPSFASVPTGIERNGKKEWALREVPSLPGKTTRKYVREAVPSYSYSSGHKMLFPRMWSSAPEHFESYNLWSGRHPGDTTMPSFGENLRYFLSYQVNHMYWRYFGWNFIGRQNDQQGHGTLLSGNVVTGIEAIDRLTVGPSQDAPYSTSKNKGHNVYYMLPLLLGLLGIVYQLLHKERGAQLFWIIFWLFFMTGLAIILYINQYPGQPRERDYAYAGSFYAFAIWIGFGVVALYEWLSKAKIAPKLAAVLATVIAMPVPILMASQNWDDHDRSGRRLAADFGHNFLESCPQDAVLFCFGDNDTFPLWYAQSVENIRTDIKVCNLSYLQGEWYGKQMLQSSHNARPVPHLYVTSQFLQNHPYVPLTPSSSVLSLTQTLQAIAESPAEQAPTISAAALRVEVDTLAAAPYFKDFPQGVEKEPYIDLALGNGGGITRGDLFVLDMIAGAQFQRPICWVSTMPISTFTNSSDYLRSRGMAKELYPWTVKQVDGGIDIETTYQNVMHKFRYFNADQKDIYFDENIRRTISYYYRTQLFGGLALALIDQGDLDRAKEVLQKCHQSISAQAVPYSTMDLLLAEAYYSVKMNKEADEIVQTLAEEALVTLRWVKRLSPRLLRRSIEEGIPSDALRQLSYAYMQAIQAQSQVLAPYQKEIETLMNEFGMGQPHQ